MKVITFYSYKGGVGRTLTAANFAVYLAKLGLHVIAIDFDLDAPGLDSKFSGFELPKGQPGLLDYILRFQRDGEEPGPIQEMLCSVPIASPREKYVLGLIPAGDYLATDYSAKLNELNWGVIFSDERDGVAFFQRFLTRIQEEHSPDVVVIDSRTGFSEIGGLCTQQLADETVIISSLARESIKMTRRLPLMIRESPIAKSLDKEVNTKVVVSRVPKPKDIDKLKTKCCKEFGVDETKLFFLFSNRELEQEEFVAMLDTSREDSLTANYIQLFQGLDIEVARESIDKEIARAEQGLLSIPKDEVESRIREMVALYPFPEVYRRAMRFFDLTRRPKESFSFGLRLLDLLPDDIEAQSVVARFWLQGDFTSHGFISRNHRRSMEGVNDQRFVSILQQVYQREEFDVSEQIRFADILEVLEQYEQSYNISIKCLETDETIEDSDMRSTAIGIAVRTAVKLGKSDDATKLLAKVPESQIRGDLADAAIQLKIAEGDKEGAFKLIRTVLSRSLTPRMLEKAVELSRELDRLPELVKMIQDHPELDRAMNRNSRLHWELERLGIPVVKSRERSSGGQHRRLKRLSE